MPGRPFFKRETRKNSCSFFDLAIATFCRIRFHGLAHKKHSRIFSAACQWSEPPNGIGEGMRFEIVLREGSSDYIKK